MKKDGVFQMVSPCKPVASLPTEKVRLFWFEVLMFFSFGLKKSLASLQPNRRFGTPALKSKTPTLAAVRPTITFCVLVRGKSSERGWRLRSFACVG